jgi:type IV pilus assembly protein PilA
MLKNKKGFSLVELMVVVAIIGILASIGIPSMQRYMAKARQSEAKTNLAGMYTTEKAFFAEFNTYTLDWGAMGYQPEGQLRYRTGFGGADTLARLNGFGFTGTISGVNQTGTQAAGVGCQNTTARPCKMTAESNSGTLANATSGTGTLQSTFVAAASALIYTGASNTVVDTWTINDTKSLLQVTNGVP